MDWMKRWTLSDVLRSERKASAAICSVLHRQEKSRRGGGGGGGVRGGATVSSIAEAAHGWSVNGTKTQSFGHGDLYVFRKEQNRAEQNRGL